MKPFILPKNKFLRLLINVFLIVAWFIFYCLIFYLLDKWTLSTNNWAIYDFITGVYIFRLPLIPILIILIPWLLITRYIWFQKSRNRIFYGLFDKLNFKKFEPRIYTTSSNADELKKYADLRDQGIITEEEFQSKKKKLLDLYYFIRFQFNHLPSFTFPRLEVNFP